MLVKSGQKARVLIPWLAIDGGANAKTVSVPEGIDAEVLAKVLGNPEMVALLYSLAKTMQN